MKKKIAFMCLLLYILSLLAACAPNVATAQKPSDVSTESTIAPSSEISESTDSTVASSSEISASADSTVASSSEISEPTDVYFATGNDYYDLYAGYSWVPGPEIRLLSREHIDPDSIQVTVDIQADYAVYVHEQETGKSLTSYAIVESEGKREAHLLSATAYDLPLYLYQTYAGMDWKTVYQKHTEYLDVMEQYTAGEVGEDQVKTALNEYNYAATEYINEYTELDIDRIPIFYEYLIQIHINDADTEEQFTTVQIAIGGDVYNVNVGEVHIRPFSAISNGYDYLTMKRSSPHWLNCYPYGSSIERCQSDIYYAEKPLTLTGLHFLENITSSVTVLDVVVAILDDQYSSAGIEIEWDGVTPIYVEQGKYVTLYITFQDDRLREINYHSKLYPVWEFQYSDNIYKVASEIPLYRYFSDRWLLYAIGFEGMDMESYFIDYYYLLPVNSWRNDVDLTPWSHEQ